MADKTAQSEKKKDEELDFEVEGEEKPEIEVEDDTPDEDKARYPLPKKIVDELEADELSEYDERVKQRMKQAKKVYHDERRLKEQEQREKQEAISFAQKLMEENKRLKSTLSEGEKHLIGSLQGSASLELNAAKAAYRTAYESGDADKVVEAQEKLNQAVYKAEEAKRFKPTLQPPEKEVEQKQEVPQVPQLDAKTRAWQERNSWWGSDEEMTASALGLHQKLEKQHGKQFVGTDDYWRSIDETIHRRFPEYFGDEKPSNGAEKSTTKPASIVAPVSRSTSPKKIVLKQSQISLARKLGLTPEQYAREVKKLEN